MSTQPIQPQILHTEQIKDIQQQLQICSAAALKLVESLPEANLKQRPANQGWSVVECIAHLTATTGLYLPIMASELENAPAGDGPYKIDWRGKFLKWILEPPYRTKVKTLPSLEPQVTDVRQALPDFLTSQKQLAEAIERWQGRALDKVFITSPFSKRMRYNIYSLFNVIAAHQRRHLWQALRVKDQIRGK